MEEVKPEHWKTREKRLRLEAESRWEVYIEAIDTPEVVEAPTPSRWYRVFNNRSALIHQTQDIEDAKSTATANGGTYSMI